ncbi:HTTM domain-containing protein [Ornithinicoccus halotolerans]|uniref:HTTM domain-containing protein n=1 Tax=Ornithinicoccus halotolerans TaxID=1748220 RepID=UPI0012970B3C|nr:HTTM domain-containing protein [Ornithinicoccus halotolerans]
MWLTKVRVDGLPIAVTRIMLAVAFAIIVVESSAVLHQIAAGRMTYPVLEVIPAPTPSAVLVYFALGMSAALFLLVGLMPGFAAALASALAAWALLWDQQTYSSHHLLCALLLGYLAFARSGARLAASAKLRGGVRGDVPWWPQLLMLTQVSVVYFFTALSKINPVFLSGEPLAGWTWFAGPGWLFQGLAVVTVATELFLAVGLWVPRLRALAVVAGVGLHAGIVGSLADQNVILFGFALLTLSTYWLFLRRPPLRLVPFSRPGRATAFGDSPNRKQPDDVTAAVSG